ncbi:hypothetical protein WMY93_000471 [Mugilogobius chulae]|uniref:Ubiquitin-like domain-containing protein n=1 Tax=Mugilogobius chulae TaxID=88201 RepID=A0AAW0Q109_9GOBI
MKLVSSGLKRNYSSRDAPRLHNSIWVCYNQGAPVAVEIEDEAKVCDLKREVGGRLGVHQIVSGFCLQEESCSTAPHSGSSCDLQEQSTVHVVLPRTNSRPPNQDPDQDYVSLTRVDLSPAEDPEPGDGPQELRAEPSEGSRGRSSFFVFCKRCGGVREGKLRVCCKTCNSPHSDSHRALPVGTMCRFPVVFVVFVCQTSAAAETETR